MLQSRDVERNKFIGVAVDTQLGPDLWRLNRAGGHSGLARAPR